MAAAKSAPPTESAAPGNTCAAAWLDAALERFIAALPAVSAVSAVSATSPARLCVALSGGRDSVVLLHALTRLAAAHPGALALSALHVNHGLSANADAWAGFCVELCRTLGVALEVVRVEVARHSGEGLEAAARRARHAAFARCDADWLALAHHRDDQAETVLLNLLRGAGVAGTAAMRPQRQLSGGPCLLRPLLDLPRAALDAYAAAHALDWVEDESNADTHYRRNYLRREVIPRLAAAFPAAGASLARAAGHFAEAAQLLDELAAIDHAALARGSGRLDLARFNALAAQHPPRARNLLRFAWNGAGFRAPDARWIDEALRQLAATDGLAQTCVATVDGEMHVYRGEIYLVPSSVVSGAAALAWSGEPELAWAGGRLRFAAVRGAGIDRRYLADAAVRIAARQGGERLQPDARRPRRSLRKLLQDAALPPWQRTRLPLLWIAGELAWVAGLGVDARYACPPGEDGVLPQWDEDDDGASADAAPDGSGGAP